MSTVDELLGHFRRQISLPWSPEIGPDYRIWILHYDKALERRIQGRLDEFEGLTRKYQHGWVEFDLGALVAPWFARHELFDELVRQPEELPSLLLDFEAHVVDHIRQRLREQADHDLVVLNRAGALFDFMRVSALAEKVAPDVKGRLLLLFPGRHEHGVYRLLDMRDGWTYRATPIPA